MKPLLPKIYMPLLFLFTLLMINQSGMAKAKQGKPEIDPRKTLLVFEKKPCFGFCPVYKAVFLKDGNVTVTYQQSGKPEAKTTFRIPKAEANALWKRGEQLGFFKMKDRYDTQRTDWPERELILYRKGKPKTVVYSEGGTAEFEAYLVDLAALVEGNLHVNFGPPAR